MEQQVPNIIAQTQEYLVIEKPSGLLTHPTEKNEPHTLTDWLVEQYPEIQSVGDPNRPGIVHRLDKLVSGVMVVARTEQMYAHLKDAFHNREVHKTYLALVHGAIEADEGVIDFSIARAKHGRGMAARPKNQHGRDALTEYLVLDRFVNHTYVQVEPKTGRTHQIRVHLFALNTPIVKDPLYWQKRYKNEKIAQRTPRIFLHATRLSFTDLEGAVVDFESPLPQELQDVLNSL